MKFRQRLGVAWRVATDRRYLHVPRGHPYSPLPAPEDIARVRADLSAPRPSADDSTGAFPGIDLRLDEQWALLEHLVDTFPDLGRWVSSTEPRRYRYDNTWFTGSDALLCALVTAHVAPQRVVEVGCGYSSALLLDTVERVGASTSFTFIEPDPSRLRSLVEDDDLDGRLLPVAAQDVDPSVFDALDAGDVLAIDSSHVVRAGSDVHHLLLDVIPRLRPGVWIHIHDVFDSFNYPMSWLTSGVAVNEAYVVRALLVGNQGLEVMLWNAGLTAADPQRFSSLMSALPPTAVETGGLWLRTAPSEPAR